MRLVFLPENTGFVRALEQEKITMMVGSADITSEQVKKCQELGITEIQKYSEYNVGEIVAVAASYSQSGYSVDWVIENIAADVPIEKTMTIEGSYLGWNDSSYVVPQAMNNMIVIDEIRLCRLSEVQTNDFMKMGLYQEKYYDPEFNMYGRRFKIYGVDYVTYKIYDAFWRLLMETFHLDEAGVKELWRLDPYVFVYKFYLLEDDKTEEIYQAWLKTVWKGCQPKSAVSWKIHRR